MQDENTTFHTSEEIFFEGDSFFERVFRDIELAKSSISLETYIFAVDSLAEKITAKLLKAAERGVKVKVLVDAFGSSSAVSYLEKKFSNSSVQMRVYHSLLGKGIFGFLKFFSSINQRNHRKIWIFDQKTAYVGSFNITDQDLSAVYGKRAWKDFALRIEGDDLSAVDKAFEKAFSSNLNRKKFSNPIPFRKEIRDAFPFYLNDTLQKRLVNHHLFLNRIRQSKTRVWFANPYFLPGLRLVRELYKAARLGKDVRILVPKRSDVFFMPWLISTYYDELLKAGVKIYEYLPSVFHAKVAIVDDWMILGSSNLNHRSLLHDLEIDVEIRDPKNRTLLEKELLSDFGKSELVTAESIRKTSVFRAFLVRVLLLFKYWM